MKTGKVKVTLKLSPVFLKEEADGTECEYCADAIYNNLYRLWLMPEVGNIGLLGRKTEICLCESCNDLVDLQ